MKPSAYISDGGILFKESPPDSMIKLTPLYTSAEIQALHNLVKEQPIVKVQPMRELTDEEILEVWKEHYGDVNISNFAKAILKKASEK
jgi:hypothetical protein